MADQESDPVSTFVTMDALQPKVFHVIHLFVFPDLSDKQPIRLVLDGFGCLWLPGIVGDRALAKMNMGGLVAVLKGKVFEDEVLERLSASGLVDDDTVVKVWPCSRDGIEFKADAKPEPEPARRAEEYIVVAPKKGKRT